MSFYLENDMNTITITKAVNDPESLFNYAKNR